MSNVPPDYNAETCITVGEMRGLGWPIPERLPDCAWIRRDSVHVKSMSHCSTPEDIAAGVLRLDTEITFAEPFNWIDLTFTIGPTPT